MGGAGGYFLLFLFLFLFKFNNCKSFFLLCYANRFYLNIYGTDFHAWFFRALTSLDKHFQKRRMFFLSRTNRRINVKSIHQQNAGLTEGLARHMLIQFKINEVIIKMIDCNDLLSDINYYVTILVFERGKLQMFTSYM